MPSSSGVEGTKASNNRNQSEGLAAASIPANLNHGNNGEKVYLCFKRSREGNPITGIIPLLPNRREYVPEGYTVLERTPRNHTADLNARGTGHPVFLSFRQRLATLEVLRPLPLIIAQNDQVDWTGSEWRAASEGGLCAYYCTGGTTVSGDAGNWHLMERNRNTWLGPKNANDKVFTVFLSGLVHEAVSISVQVVLPRSKRGIRFHRIRPRWQ